MQTVTAILAIPSSDVLQYESGGSTSANAAPVGTSEEEFSLESLQGSEMLLGDVLEQKELGATLSSLPLIIFPLPLIPFSYHPIPYSSPSPSQCESIKSYYLTQLPAGLVSLLPLILRHRQLLPPIFYVPSFILTQTQSQQSEL